MALKRTWVICIALAVLVLVVGIGWLGKNNSHAIDHNPKLAAESGSPVSHLSNLLALRPDALPSVDIARLIWKGVGSWY